MGGPGRWRPGLAPALSCAAGPGASGAARQPGAAAAQRRGEAGPDVHAGLYRGPRAAAGRTDPPVRGHGTPAQWLGRAAYVPRVYASHRLFPGTHELLA